MWWKCQYSLRLITININVIHLLRDAICSLPPIAINVNENSPSLWARVYQYMKSEASEWQCWCSITLITNNVNVTLCLRERKPVFTVDCDRYPCNLAPIVARSRIWQWSQTNVDKIQWPIDYARWFMFCMKLSQLWATKIIYLYRIVCSWNKNFYQDSLKLKISKFWVSVLVYH